MAHKADKAVILAAGVGSRLKPLTDYIPKSLIEINEVPMIEAMIQGFFQNGIGEINIVVGHLKEQFRYLAIKYPGVYLIENPHYATQNNISSLYLARYCLENAIICDGDLILRNPAILHTDFEFSGYLSIWADRTNEWLQTTCDEGFVIDCSRVGGRNGWQLVSLSFWSAEDGRRLKQHLEEIYPKNTNIFWDDIPMFLRRDEYRLKVRPIKAGDIVEIDTIEELYKFKEVST